MCSLAMLVRTAGRTGQHAFTMELGVIFSFIRWARESGSIRLAHEGGDPTVTAYRLVAGEVFDVEPLKRAPKRRLG